MAQKTKQRMDAVVAKVRPAWGAPHSPGGPPRIADVPPARVPLQLGVPVQIFMALQKDEYRKPETGMWQYMVEHCNDGIQPGSAPPPPSPLCTSLPTLPPSECDSVRCGRPVGEPVCGRLCRAADGPQRLRRGQVSAPPARSLILAAHHRPCRPVHR